jgi:hypothetical protein
MASVAPACLLPFLKCGAEFDVMLYDLAATRKRGGQYLVGTPRSQMKQFEEELLKDDWTRVRPEVEVKKVAIPQGEEFRGRRW